MENITQIDSYLTYVVTCWTPEQLADIYFELGWTPEQLASAAEVVQRHCELPTDEQSFAEPLAIKIDGEWHFSIVGEGAEMDHIYEISDRVCELYRPDSWV